jgi:hypothetical protein
MGNVFILLILGFPTVVSWATSLRAQNVWNQTDLVALWWAQFSSTAAGSWPCDTFKVNLTLSQSGHHISGPNWNCPSFRAPIPALHCHLYDVAKGCLGGWRSPLGSLPSVRFAWRISPRPLVFSDNGWMFITPFMVENHWVFHPHL